MVAYHAGLPLPGGFIGVDVFFVISGFVICRLLATELRETGSIRLGKFYIRRIRRLLPALAVVLVCVAVASSLIQSPIGAQQDTARTGLGASAWLSNGVLYLITGGYFDNAADSIPLLHTWSLSVEEQFYVFFPTLIALAWWIGRRLGVSPQRAVGATLGLVSASSFALSGVPVIWPQLAWCCEARFGGLLLDAHPGVGIRDRRHPRADVRAAGRSPPAARRPGLAWRHRGHSGERLDRRRCAIPWMVGARSWTGHRSGYWGCYANSGSLTRLLSNQAMISLGDLSYSWYLWHFPFIVLSSTLWVDNAASKLVAAVVSLGVAFLSYKFVENPIRKRRPELRRSGALVLACVGLPIIAMLGLLTAANHGWFRTNIREAQAQLDPVPIGYGIGCHSLVPIGDRNLTRCSFGHRGTRVWLVGDSNAGQYADGLVELAQAGKLRITLATASGCPMVNAQVLTDGQGLTNCGEFVTRSIQWLKEQPPSHRHHVGGKRSDWGLARPSEARRWRDSPGPTE